MKAFISLGKDKGAIAVQSDRVEALCRDYTSSGREGTRVVMQSGQCFIVNEEILSVLTTIEKDNFIPEK